jgi:SAM-dependent methyltransferase
MKQQTHDSSSGYDAVVDEYVRQISRELEHKPFDRALLDRFASGIRSNGVVADIGCGPGHVGRYLHERGVRICGLDLSAGMVESARSLNPGIELMHGDMRAISVPDGTWAGIVAFYSIIHIPRDQVLGTLREFARVLEPGAPLLLAFHIGDQVLHLDEWWEQKVSLDFYFFQPTEMREWLVAAGFKVEEVLEREPYAEDVEHQSRRCYISARKPLREGNDAA